MKLNSHKEFSKGILLVLLTYSFAYNVVLVPKCLAQSYAIKHEVTEDKFISLNDVVNSTLAYHPLMNAAQQDLLAAEGEVLASKGAFDRVIKGDALDYAFGGYSGAYYNLQAEQPLETWGSKIVGGYRQGAGTFPIYDNYYETNSDGELRLGVEVPVLRDRATDKRRVAMGKASLQQIISGLSLEQRKLEMARASAFAYLEWQAAHARNQVFNALLKVAKERDKQFAARAKSGDLADFDRADNERQVFQREAQAIAAARALNRAQLELSYFWRDPFGASRDVADFKPKQPTLTARSIFLDEDHKAVEEAYSLRPDLERLDKIRAQQQLEVQLAENELLPKLDVQSYLARDLGTGSEDRDENELRLGLRMEIPLQTRNQEGRMKQASAKAAEATYQAQALKERIAVEVRDTKNAIELARNRLELARKEVALTKQLEEGERDKFAHGDSSLIFVNLREQASADAAVREVDTFLELNKLAVSYDIILGREIAPH